MVSRSFFYFLLGEICLKDYLSRRPQHFIKLINKIIVVAWLNVTYDSEKKACTWSAKDYRTDEPVLTTFLAKFSSTEAALEFKTRFDQVCVCTFMHSKFWMNRFLLYYFSNLGGCTLYILNLG